MPRTRRSAIIKTSCALCWVAALSTLIWEIPGDKTENLIYAISVASTLMWRSEPGPNMREHIRHIGRILYMRGFNDGMRRGGSEGSGTKAPTPEPEPEPPEGKAPRPRRWPWAVRLALPAMLVGGLAVAFVASPGLPFVQPMPGVYVQQESAVEPIRTGPTRAVKAPARAKTDRRSGSARRTSTGSPRAKAPAAQPMKTVPEPSEAAKAPVKTVRSKAPKVPRPRPALSSLLDR